MVCRTIRHAGTERQRREVISAALRGEIVIALGYTEPGCGSDVAAVKTTALRQGTGWLINGQKMFTSTADQATHVFLLTRTDAHLPKHDGLTTFLVPVTAPGVSCEPISTLGGIRTNATFYVDVLVEDSDRVGEVNGGWSVMRIALVYERTSSFAAPIGAGIDQRVADWARTATSDDGSAVLDDPSVRERLARIAIDDEVTKLLGMRSAWASMQGDLSGLQGSSHKLWKTEAACRHHADLMDILGDQAVLNRGVPNAPLSGDIEESFRTAVVETIRGGTSEILRSIIAERGLGLPRVRPPRARGEPRSEP
jgi:alkylation response protein AidB-like acyl-CoA dehydrogenase